MKLRRRGTIESCSPLVFLVGGDLIGVSAGVPGSGVAAFFLLGFVLRGAAFAAVGFGACVPFIAAATSSGVALDNYAYRFPEHTACAKGHL